MHGAGHRAAAFLLSVSLWVCLGCAATYDVSVDQRGDLAGFCSWDFLPLGSGAVQAPHSDAVALNAGLARLIERSLLSRGLARVADHPDVYVTYFLEVQRQVVVTSETPALEHLSSLNHTTSYDIQTSERRVDVQELGALTILLSDREQQHVVWRGTLEGRFRGEMSQRMEEAVSKLLERIPAPLAPPEARDEQAVRAGPAWECTAGGRRGRPTARPPSTPAASDPPPRG